MKRGKNEVQPERSQRSRGPQNRPRKKRSVREKALEVIELEEEEHVPDDDDVSEEEEEHEINPDPRLLREERKERERGIILAGKHLNIHKGKNRKRKR